MTLTSEIISLAYREANYKAVGDSTPTANESTEALALLQALSDSFFGMIVGTKLKSWYLPWPQKTASVAANFPADPGYILPDNPLYPPANVRIMAKNTTAKTVFFQFQPEDGALMEYVDVGHTATLTLDANGALFGLTGGDTTVTFTSDFPTNRNAPKRWIYRADAGSWVEIGTLATDEEMPYPTWFNDYWITALAIRLSPRFGNEPRMVTMKREQDMKVFLRGMYEQMAPAIIGSPVGRHSLQVYNPSSTGYDPSDFDDGIV